MTIATDSLLLALLVGVVAIIAIAVVTVLGQRLGVAGPLLLVALGIAFALITRIEVRIDPEIILIGVLPPLLYSAAVQLPAIEFRRDFGPIAGLSVLLVVISSLVLGLFFWMVIPSVGLALGVALGAILSPTDAVATSIVKRLGISPRVVTMLEGESLLNDATALVILRTATVALASSFAFGNAIGAFAWGVLIAVVIGAIVGWLALRLRSWVGSSAANTAISIAVPFLAYLPTEHFGGSGLVAAVVAGIVTGQGAPRRLTPEQRLSDTMNWRTIELVLEGAVFLVMGLELRDIVATNADTDNLWHPAWLALSALGIILAIRAVYVTGLVWTQSRRARRYDRERLEGFTARIDQMQAGEVEIPQRRGFPTDPVGRERRFASVRRRVSRLLTDIDYYQASPLGWRHGTIIVWAGMRGVVTLAAAQTLPRDDPNVTQRALLVFVAFLVAFFSLMLQGFTLPWVVRALGLRGSGAEAVSSEERARLDEQLREAAAAVLAGGGLTQRDGTPFSEDFVARVGERMSRAPDDDQTALAHEMVQLRLIAIEAMRTRLDELGHDGSFSTAALRHALAELDADQLSLELRLDD